MSDLLLDTCAIIWLGAGDRIEPQAARALDDRHDRRKPLLVSPFSAWELAMLIARNRLRLPMEAATWFERFVERSESMLAPLSPRILAASCALPGAPPNDPADRIIIATARDHDLTIMTRDRKILGYAHEGHVKALAC